MTNDRPTAIDLFCGAGGLTLGLKQAGFNVLAGVELEAIPAQTYEANHKEVICFRQDIRKLGVSELLTELALGRGELSLLAGCPPCQGFSSLRTKRQAFSVDDPRNDLLFEFLRIVEGIYPKVVMMENVPALASDQRMLRFREKLSKLGYGVGSLSIRVEDAADYGVPQRRNRMIMIASRIGPVKAAERSSHVTVRECFEAARLAEVGKSKDPLHDYIPKRAPHVQDIIANIPKDGGSRSSLPEHLVLQCHKAKGCGFRDVYGRMAWDAVAPTITGGCGNPSKGRYLHPEEDRAITLREAALIQTFPADYKFDLSKGRERVALMIGNALPPEFIRRQAIKIFDALTRE